jgi:CheY-like chemotaxis protein
LNNTSLGPAYLFNYAHSRIRRGPAEPAAYGEEGDRLKAISAGFQAHMAKPVAPADLVTEIARLAGR